MPRAMDAPPGATWEVSFLSALRPFYLQFLNRLPSIKPCSQAPQILCSPALPRSYEPTEVYLLHPCKLVLISILLKAELHMQIYNPRL